MVSFIDKDVQQVKFESGLIVKNLNLQQFWSRALVDLNCSGSNNFRLVWFGVDIRNSGGMT